MTIEQIKQQLEEVWMTAVEQQTVHIRPRIDEVVAELDRETVEQLGPFLESLYRRSDRRVDLCAALMVYSSQRGLFRFKISTAMRLVKEGYAADDVVRQLRLKELAVTCEE